MTEPTPIRTDCLYISYTNRAGLKYIADAMEIEGRADALADEIISSWLKVNHPQVVEHLKQRWEDDKAFKESLMKRLNNKPFAKQ